MTDGIQDDFAARLTGQSSRWLVTGAGGFIGSNLVESLLSAGQEVVGLDNFLTGHRSNLEEVARNVGPRSWARFELIEADIRDREACARAAHGIDYVLHQAALGSVPRSLEEPLTAHDVNVTGFVNMIEAARNAGVKRFVYAASSSTYGDEPTLPKREDRIGNPLSPYAATKFIDEVYAATYARSYGFPTVGLRYFNVFGQRQDPDGPYAAVIPKWIQTMIAGDEVVIHGDGSTSRDFCYVANTVQANLRAALAGEDAQNQVYNVAVGERTTLAELFELLRDSLGRHQVHYSKPPKFTEFRPGDVLHSHADISKARNMLGYEPTHRLADGLEEALHWYVRTARRSAA